MVIQRIIFGKSVSIQLTETELCLAHLAFKSICSQQYIKERIDVWAEMEHVDITWLTETDYELYADVYTKHVEKYGLTDEQAVQEVFNMIEERRVAAC